MQRTPSVLCATKKMEKYVLIFFFLNLLCHLDELGILFANNLLK